MTEIQSPQPAPLPCPFCGSAEGLHFGDGTTFRWGVASCKSCDASAGEVRRAYPDDGAWHAEAIKEWNTRAAIPAPEGELAQAAADLVQAVRRDWPSTPTHRAAALAAADKVSAALAAQAVMINGLTEAETSETASVRGLIGRPAPAEAHGELTDEQIVAHLEAAGIKFQRFMGGVSSTKDCWSTAGSQDVRKLAAGIRAIVTASKPQPKGMPDGYKLLEDGKTMIPEDWTPLRLEWEPGYPEDVACGPARAMERLKKWLDAYFLLIQQRMTPAPAVAPDDARDAARWRAFINCARIRFFGWAGLDKNGDPTSERVHFGAEFWTHHEARTADPAGASKVLTSFADAALQSGAASQPPVQGSQP